MRRPGAKRLLCRSNLIRLCHRTSAVVCVLLQIPLKPFKEKKALQAAERVAKTVQAQTGCQIYFYRPSDVMLDEAAVKFSQELQSSPPFHLDRIDQPSLPIDGHFYWNASGRRVTVFVLDAVKPQVVFVCIMCLRRESVGSIRSFAIARKSAFVFSLGHSRTQIRNSRAVWITELASRRPCFVP